MTDKKKPSADLPAPAKHEKRIKALEEQVAKLAQMIGVRL